MKQTVSSVIALLNDFRISQGKATLGFLNPVSSRPVQTSSRWLIRLQAPLCQPFCPERHYERRQPRLWYQRFHRYVFLF